MTTAGDGLAEEHGRWLLPITDGEVTQVRVDFAFGLVVETDGDEPASVSIRINTPFELVRDGNSLMIDPEQTADLGPLVTLHKAKVREAHAAKDGRLVVRFADGRAIDVAPDEQFEAWQVDGHLPPVATASATEVDTKVTLSSATPSGCRCVSTKTGPCHWPP